MRHFDDWFEEDSRPKLYHQWWLPDEEPTAVVIVVHGFTEHSGRYAPLAEKLVEQGYAVHALDLPGHGKSLGERVYIEAFAHYLRDVTNLVTRVHQKHPELPTFLFGHSMGGTIVALFLASQSRVVADSSDAFVENLVGAVLSAPAACVGHAVFPWLRHVASSLSRIVPKLRLVKLGRGMLSRDPEVVAQFENDPLVFRGRFPVRTGAEILGAMQRLQDDSRSISLPLLILQGTGDKVVAPQGARQLHFHAASSDKTLNVYEGLYHDLLNEPEKDQVMADLIAWLDGHR